MEEELGTVEGSKIAARQICDCSYTGVTAVVSDGASHVCVQAASGCSLHDLRAPSPLAV